FSGCVTSNARWMASRIMNPDGCIMGIIGLAGGIFGFVDVISTSTYKMGVGPSQPNTLRVWAMYDTAAPPPPVVAIFDLNISPASVGSTFTLDSGLKFQQTVDFLTNGQEGWLAFFFDGSGTGRPKSFFNGGYPAIDLRGFTIEALVLRLDE